MIQKIGVIFQDVNSLGLLKGLRTRLGCNADFVPPPAPVGRSVTMTRTQAKIACAFFRKQGVDLIVRFTDADDQQWQHVRTSELATLRQFASASVVCGVAVRNTEHWLARMRVAQSLGISLPAGADPTDHVKAAISKAKNPYEDASSTIARLVSEAPTSSFKACFADSAFTTFYDDCRAEASLAGCDTANEQ